MPMSVVYATVNGRMVQENRGGTITRYVADTLGSVIQTRNASGVQTSSTTYWPYGEVRTSTGTNPSPWGFVGTLGYFRDALSRLYIRARYYIASIGRWNTVDPLWPDESAYGYVKNIPSGMVDPTGLKPGKVPKRPTWPSGGTGCLSGPRQLEPCEEILNGLVPRVAKRVEKCIINCGLYAPDCWAKCLQKVADSKDWPIYAEYLACLFSSGLNGSPGNPCSGSDTGVTVWRQECCDMWFMQCVLIKCGPGAKDTSCYKSCLDGHTQCYLDAEVGRGRRRGRQ